MDEARGLDAKELEHVIDAPPMRPQFEHHPEKRIRLLEDAGFSLKRETACFEWRGGKLLVVPERLSFRTLEEVGEWRSSMR